MKFLTEDDLRVKYSQFPFDTFTLKKDHRLTPGARTFLMDRKIPILDENALHSPKDSLLKTSTPAIQKHQEEDWQIDAKWLDIRCEILQIAFDLASIDMMVAQELTVLERCLSAILSGGECVFPSLSSRELSEDTIDKAYIRGNLSNVGMFLQTDNGYILTKLYPLYFHLEQLIEHWQIASQGNLVKVLERIGQLIAHYLKNERGSEL